MQKLLTDFDEKTNFNLAFAELQNANLLDKTIIEKLIDEIYSKEYEESVLVETDVSADYLESLHSDLFDEDLMAMRGQTPEMDILDYIYWNKENEF